MRKAGCDAAARFPREAHEHTEVAKWRGSDHQLQTWGDKMAAVPLAEATYGFRGTHELQLPARSG